MEYFVCSIFFLNSYLVQNIQCESRAFAFVSFARKNFFFFAFDCGRRKVQLNGAKIPRNDIIMADTYTAKSTVNRHASSNGDATPSKHRLPQHKAEPSTSSGEKVGGNLSIDCCSDPCSCMTLYDILKSFNAPVSEEQMWALIYQSVKLYRDALHHSQCNFKDLRAPASTQNLNIHKDGSVHVSFDPNGELYILLLFFFILYIRLSCYLPQGYILLCTSIDQRFYMERFTKSFQLLT